ncbi:DUF4097 family beta strand repeat protein [Actinoplanes sp. LDG1-01]|uniref:DUF4097 family beta strand repeat protein n=1 Tax=Paractinoplanes lichenicola TaxID=2802976 RepID=A0ABS1W0R8_9ACTN|nr:DUF4097 family beta strand repeat protein [Actinoplanes lichenicola]
MQKFDSPSAVSATVDVPAGRIQFIAGERADTTVEIRPSDAGKKSDVKAADGIEVTFADGALRVEAAEPTNRLLGSSGSVEVTVLLPTDSKIDAKSALADFRGVGRLGDVTIEAAQGSIKLDETATAHLTLQSGDISVGRLGGSAEISTQQGNLQISEAVTGTVELNTTRGDITVGAAPGSSATLDAGTTYGRVRNSLKNTDGAATALNIRATTAHGDITAESR